MKITHYTYLVKGLMEKVAYWYPEESDNVAFFLENLEEGQTLYYLENGHYYSDGDSLITKIDGNKVEFDLDQIFTLTLRPGTYVLAADEALI